MPPVKKSLLACVLFLGLAASAPAVDVRLFGDVYLSERAVRITGSTPEDPALFADVAPLIATSDFNVVNFEGVATTAFVPHESKRYLLSMHHASAAMLKSAGIHAVTLANNHAMDFGYQGLFDSLTSLRDAGLDVAGAGIDAATAARPIVFAAGNHIYCLLAFSRTLPESFWATGEAPGTAVGSLTGVQAAVSTCVQQGWRTIVSFHWGQEGVKKPFAYQRELAHRAIDSGATLVVGHHPHVLQEVEFYKGRPVVYSLGNFAFGSDPKPGTASGMAAGLTTSDDGRLSLELTPLEVRNDLVRFKPRPLRADEPDPIPALLPKTHTCRKDSTRGTWTCALGDPES